MIQIIHFTFLLICGKLNHGFIMNFKNENHTSYYFF
ncbi:MAG: hypothetical protein FADNKDHG_01361 [Holosporales bacterium]